MEFAIAVAVSEGNCTFCQTNCFEALELTNIELNELYIRSSTDATHVNFVAMFEYSEINPDLFSYL